MTLDEKYTYWLELAQYDLESADAMFTSGRWFYVIFMCQQAMEKLCKGIYNYYIDDNVPKIHNIRFILKKIEDKLSLTIDPEIYGLADTLSAYYLSNRYPDFSRQSSIIPGKEKARNLLDKTRKAFTWLLTLKK